MKATSTSINNSIKTKKFAEQKHIEYHYFVPKQINHVLVLIHGISRNADEIINEFSKIAETHCVLLIAPVFNKSFSTDYQRLGRKGKGPRSDYQLMAIIKDCQKELMLSFKRFDIFGFSAGAQYTHRFALAHPNLVNKVVLVAAGWYTLPTFELPYPRGLRIKNQFSDIVFEPSRFLRIPFKVFIGSLDNKRDRALNKNIKIDLTQGKNRLARARNWVELMRFQVEKQGIKNNIELEILTDVEHDFIDCVDNAQLTVKAMNWFFQESTGE